MFRVLACLTLLAAPLFTIGADDKKATIGSIDRKHPKLDELIPKDARIEVIPDEENPGYYIGKFMFVPHYQLEGMDVSLSMVSRLPNAGG